MINRDVSQNCLPVVHEYRAHDPLKLKLSNGVMNVVSGFDSGARGICRDCIEFAELFFPCKFCHGIVHLG